MRTRRYHFGDRPSRTLLPFFVSRQKDEWWSEKIFPRGCLSLSRSSRQTKALPRDRNTDDDVLSLSLSRSFRSRRRDNEACVCPRRFPRACVQIPPMGKDPQNLCALSLSCASLETERRTKNVAREYSRSLDGLAMPARLSRSRIRECKEREKRSKICPESASFFPRSFISPIKCSQFSQRLARANDDDGWRRSFFSNPTHTGRRRRRRRRRRRKKRTL